MEAAANFFPAKAVVADQVVKVLKDRATIGDALLKLHKGCLAKCPEVVCCPGTRKAFKLEGLYVVVVCAKIKFTANGIIDKLVDTTLSHASAV